jgi:hypothetical protein
MKATRLTLHRTIFLALALLLTSLILPPVAAADSLSPEQAIQRAWRAAHDAGVYHFTSDVVQTSYPAPALGNVGRSPLTGIFDSTRNQLHLEGDVDLPARTMQMRMWTGAGSVANPDSAAEMRIEGNRAWARQGGGSWQEVEDFSGGFAPGGDFLSYLVGVKNVERGAWSVERGAWSVERSDDPRFTLHATRFTFDLDGPVFANYMRDQLESYLRDKGELPLNLRLDSSRTYQQMTGQGEILLDERGLPLRLTIHLVYPPDKHNERVEADITTDFGFDIGDLGLGIGQSRSSRSAASSSSPPAAPPGSTARWSWRSSSRWSSCH